MARPTKSVNTTSKNLTKEEKKIRQETEQKLRGQDDNITPPTYLHARQKKIFNYIVEEMKASGILGNLDIYILSITSIAIDRIQEIEKKINKDSELLKDRALMATKDKYTSQFFRGCNELSLSPASRAKLGNINLQQKEKEADPLLQLLKGGGDK